MAGYVSSLAQNMMGGGSSPGQTAQPQGPATPYATQQFTASNYDDSAMDPTHVNGTFNANGAQGSGYYNDLSNAQIGLNQQQYYANQFRNNIPSLENTMGNQMANTVGGQMDQGIKQTQQTDSSRGLLYGGIHAGDEQQVRNAASGQLAQGRSNINAGINQAANTMDNQAVQTGVQIQQQQQQMQDQIYANAMASMAGKQAGVSGLFQAGGMAAGMALAGNPVAGGLIGQQAGKAVG